MRHLADQPATPDVNFVTACVTSSDGYPLATLLGTPPRHRPPATAVGADRHAEQLEAQWPAIRERAAGGMIRAVLAHHERPELRAAPTCLAPRPLTETLTALTRRAHADRLTVAARIESAADFDAALAAGVDWIVHLPGYANPLGDPPERFLISQESAEQAAKARSSSPRWPRPNSSSPRPRCWRRCARCNARTCAACKWPTQSC